MQTINNTMGLRDKELFKDHSDYWQVADNLRDIYLSEGSLLTLLDFERVLDELDVYAFKNWEIGELVAGPDISKYKVTCIFMWPKKLMPDPRAVKRLWAVGCEVKWMEHEIKVPIEVTNYDDLVPGTNYPKSAKRKVWLVKITIPMELMDDIKEGSIDLAGSTIDLEDLDSAYDEDLDKQGTEDTEDTEGDEDQEDHEEDEESQGDQEDDEESQGDQEDDADED